MDIANERKNICLYWFVWICSFKALCSVSNIILLYGLGWFLDTTVKFSSLSDPELFKVNTVLHQRSFWSLLQLCHRVRTKHSVEEIRGSYQPEEELMMFKGRAVTIYNEEKDWQKHKMADKCDLCLLGLIILSSLLTGKEICIFSKDI